MGAGNLTRGATMSEAELEAGLSHALRHAFPWIHENEIRHQLRFTVKLGHQTIEVDGQTASKASGRSDILLTRKDRPLAILELKRPGLALTDADRRQGLSYARLLEPWAPLVVVTNGDETQVFSTFTGEPWTPDNANEAAFADLLDASTELAKGDLRAAVETLLGPDSETWVSIIDSITQSTLANLTGPWDDARFPFPDDLMLPRRATPYIIDRLATTKRCIVVTGPPLYGKSNVLREVILRPEDRGDMAALFVDASSLGHGILQTLSNAMTSHFGWSMNKDDIRGWLIKLSQAAKGAALALVIDGTDSDLLRAELDEFVSASYGERLRILVAVDEAMVDRLTKNLTGRQATQFGRLAEIITLTLFDDDEFVVAANALHRHRVGFMKGAQRELAYRVPWMLRMIAAEVISDEQYKDQTVEAMIPSVAGLDTLAFARKRFEGSETLIGRFHTLAEAILADLQSGRSKEFVIASLHAFLCRRDTARRHLGELEFASLIDDGYVKHSTLKDGTRVIVPQVPELVLATLPTALAREFAADVKMDAEKATMSLVSLCASLPAGDLIGAMAIYEAARMRNGLPLDVFRYLIEDEPREETARPGGRAALPLEGGITLEVEFLDDGAMMITGPDGSRHRIEPDPDEAEHRLLSHYTSWLILSQFAGMRLGAVRPGESEVLARADRDILLHVGQCPYPLIRPLIGAVDAIRERNVEGVGRLVCHEAGIIEPITSSLMRALRNDRETGEFIVREAVQSENLPLLVRLFTVLTELSQIKDKDVSAWARNRLDDAVRPAIRDSRLLH